MEQTVVEPKKEIGLGTVMLVVGIVIAVIGAVVLIIWLTTKDQCEDNSDCGTNKYCKEGTCVCKTGYTGDDCLTTNKCLGVVCENDGECDVDTGECDCVGGWSGDQCDYKDCDPSCKNDGVCDTTKGECICVGDWEGDDCNTPLIPSYCKTEEWQGIDESGKKILFEFNDPSDDCLPVVTTSGNLTINGGQPTKLGIMVPKGYNAEASINDPKVTNNQGVIINMHLWDIFSDEIRMTSNVIPYELILKPK